jgi:hypothetical protein
MPSRLSLFAAGVLAALVASVITLVIFRPAASQQRIVRTQAVEITDASGQIRITLDAFGGKPAVWLYDGGRQRRLALTITAQGVPEVALYDGHGQARMLIRVGAERAAELRVTDALGRPRIGLWVDFRDDPGIWMFDGLARPRIGLKVSAGEPRLWLFDNPTGQVTFAAP